MTWAGLPSEILQIALSYLTAEQLIQCQLTCFNWSRHAQQALYKDVRIATSDQLLFFIDTISTSDKRPGSYLRKLYLDCHFDQESTNNTLDSLTMHSPHIEHLELTTSTDQFWSRLVQERKNGQWKYLRMVQPPLSISQYKLYYETMMVMQETTEALMICDSFFSQYPTVSLDTFVRVKKLTLKKSTEMTLHELEKTIDALPQLTDLAIRPSFQFAHVEHPPYDKILKGVMPTNKLIRLQVDLFRCLNETFLYIMKKFPKLLHINISFLNQPVSHLDPVVIKKFAEYLNRLESFHIRQLATENLKDIAIILIEAFRKKHINCHVDVHVHSNQTWFKELGLSYGSKGSQPESAGKPGFALLIKNKNRVLPLTSILKQMGPFVTSLKIFHISDPPICFVPQGFVHDKVLDHHYLSDILVQSPQLKKLELTNMKLIASDFEGQHPLETLVLCRCTYSPKLLFQLSKQLPCLKNLSISRSEIMDTSTLSEAITTSYFVIDMPYTNFDTFDFTRLSGYMRDQYIFLKLSTAQKTQFFKYDKKTPMTITEQEYQESISIATAHTIDIKCQSIAHIQLSDFGHHICHSIMV